MLAVEVKSTRYNHCASRNTDPQGFRSKVRQSITFSFLGTLTKSQVFARKIMRLTGRIKEDDVKNEMRAVAKLCMTQNTHQNIVAVFDYGCLSSFLYFIDMELCDLNLEQWIYRTWDEATANKLAFLTAELPPRARLGQVWDIMEDITRAVAFIHDSHEIHRDLKPSNG
jgi:serine/threonine protein kinase